MTLKEYYSQYRKKNRAKMRAACKRYREKNREKLRAKSKEWRIHQILKTL